MNIYIFKNKILLKAISLFVILAFGESVLFPSYIPKALAQNALGMPSAGTLVNLSEPFTPLIVRGLQVFPKDPLRLNFIIDQAESKLENQELKKETEKLISYFLSALTLKEDNLWVNLSPHEKHRIIPDDLARTEMGRDMLAQDYLLKQVTASLIHPEGKTGKEFWGRVYKKAYEQYGTTQIPIDTFNKVWIAPNKVKVYVKADRAFVVESSLKVMLEQDYLALKRSADFQKTRDAFLKSDNALASEIVREILIPELEKEVNEGKNFAQLRQIYNSMILATWFKDRLK